jgi:3-oxoacyl-[acyl-carrier protein] reductase
MDLGLRGKVAAIGASSKGLGRACAEALAREGCDVAISARGRDALEATAADLSALGVRVHAVVADLAEPGACESFVASTVEVLGRLDIVVCNNGGPPGGPSDAFDDDAYRAAMEGSFLIHVRLARAAIPHMRARGWGRIVNITSGAAKQPIEGLVLSNAARPAVAGYAKTLSFEVGRDGITVNTVAPGPFRTDRIMQLVRARMEGEGIGEEEALAPLAGNVPVGRIGDPAELGALVAFLASEQAAYLTGTTIQVDGGQTRFVF